MGAVLLSGASEEASGRVVVPVLPLLSVEPAVLPAVVPPADDAWLLSGAEVSSG